MHDSYMSRAPRVLPKSCILWSPHRAARVWIEPLNFPCLELIVASILATRPASWISSPKYMTHFSSFSS